jgi:hypothetical protein
MILEFAHEPIEGWQSEGAARISAALERLSRLLSSGILFPDETRRAEQMVRELNRLTGASDGLQPAARAALA